VTLLESAGVGTPTLRWHRVDHTLWVATTGLGRGGAHAGLIQRTALGFDARDHLNRALGIHSSHTAATRAVLSAFQKIEGAS